MWLKAFLNFGPERPAWAFFAEDIMRRHVPLTCRVRDIKTRCNPLLQAWSPNLRALPPAVKSLLVSAKKYGVRMEGLAIDRDILRELPMWHHAHADPETMQKLAANVSSETKCLRSNHLLLTVGEFEILAGCKDSTDHTPNNRCKCPVCEVQRSSAGCRHPHRCYVRAAAILDTLPQKWDPRAEQPVEDDIDITHPDSDEGIPFDPRITVRGSLADVFRIFTDSSPVHPTPPTLRVSAGRTHLTVATDGSCFKNGELDAKAGAGVFIEENHPENRAIRLPPTMAQSNQTGELVGTLVASQSID
ncbi:hypothetical protein BD310DRAFT_776819, partial [Dichomitus squalens]